MNAVGIDVSKGKGCIDNGGFNTAWHNGLSPVPLVPDGTIKILTARSILTNHDC